MFIFAAAKEDLQALSAPNTIDPGHTITPINKLRQQCLYEWPRRGPHRWYLYTGLSCSFSWSVLNLKQDEDRRRARGVESVREKQGGTVNDHSATRRGAL